jgi:hypothetical protein
MGRYCLACRSIFAAAALFAALSGAGPAFGQAAKKEAPPAPAGATSVMTAPKAEVTGFRSARFGMNEAEVKAAILKDFNLKGDAVRDQANPGERTKALVIAVPDLLPGGGKADVSYVFGYQTKKLIQITASWSKATDDKMTPEQLFSNSTVLREFFMTEGYKSDTVATNMPVANGVLIFRGSDASERSTILILQGSLAEGKDKQRVLTPTGLLLFYVANAKTPDIYRLPQGSF